MCEETCSLMKFPNKFVRLTSVITEDDDSTYKKLMKVLDEVSYFQVTLQSEEKNLISTQS